MNQELIQKLQYSYAGQNEACSLPLPLKDSLQLISDFFANNTTNKLCLVFPSKEFVAQWLTIPIALHQVKSNFNRFKNEIAESYKFFKAGDKLLLNNEAVVEWVCVKSVDKNGSTKKVAVFRTKSTMKSSSLEISIPFEKITKLQRTSKMSLSSQKNVMSVLPKKNVTPIERLLEIETFGNKDFIKNNTCLITKYKSFDDSINNIAMNHATLPEYFQAAKIDENGKADVESSLLISNNLSNLSLYTIQNPVSTIIIDGITAIQERGTDFSDIDVKGIPTILITDLSEIDSFEFIGNYGFEFFNFTKKNLNLDHQSGNSPFHTFNKKLKKYFQFNLVKEICQSCDLETITQKIHFIEKDDSNNDLNMLKIHLIQLTNLVSRICHVPAPDEISSLNQKLNTIENLFQRTRMWLGDSHKPIEESILFLKSIIEKFISQPSEKCTKLKTLMSQHNYDYIICPTTDEAQALRNYLAKNSYNTKVISVTDMTDNMLTNQPVKAVITGWAKSKNLNRIFSSFLFSELTVLFYQFENNYYNSLQRRNRKYSENVKSTVSKKGVRSPEDSAKLKGFEDLYSFDEGVETTSGNQFDILEFELKFDNVQYSRYKATGDIADSIRAKRIDFENDFFIYYASESHKLLVINELLEKTEKNAKIYMKTTDTIIPGDVVVTLITTDKDILLETINKMTNDPEFDEVKKWAGLWQVVLRKCYKDLGYDFNSLLKKLREVGCERHETTIKNWLQDDNMIGPESDEDILIIGELASFVIIKQNIERIRRSISKMTGWRMQAADLISNKIKSMIRKIIDDSLINNKTEIEGLGSVTILKIKYLSKTWQNIDARYVNRLLQKEII